MAGPERRAQLPEFRCCSGLREALIQAAENCVRHPAMSRVLVLPEGHESPHLGPAVVTIKELPGDDADDRAGRAFKTNGPSDGGRIPIESLSPHAFADDDEVRRRGGGVFTGNEGT